jgi:hypothetical protein
MARSFRRPRNVTNRPRCRAGAGQTLVEFALLLPIFVISFLGLIEFSLAFNANLNLGYASKNAALLAAEAGNAGGADCVILDGIEGDVGVPASPSRIGTVSIYWANPDGSVKGTNSNVYTRGGSTSCTYPDGTTVTVPYTSTSIGYPYASRCTTLKGCGATHPGLDTVGVSISYTHPWVTPLAKLIGGSGASFAFVSASTMRMEPVL